MARLVTCGFELNSTVVGHEAANTFAPSGVGGSISSTIKRSGTYAGRVSGMSSGSAASVGETKFVSADGAGPFFFRHYFYFVTFPSAANRIIDLLPAAAASQGFVTIDGSGVLALGDEDGTVGTSASALALNTWYRIEVEFNGTGVGANDTLKLYVDGSQVAGSTTRNFSSGISVHVVGGNLNTEANTSGDWYIDDLAINDSTGTQQTGLPGAGSVCYLRPNGAGDADTGSPTRGGADSGTIQGQIDEVTPNDATDYVVLPANPSDYWVDMEAGSVGGIAAADAVTLVEVHGRVSAASATASNWFPQIQSQAAGTKVSPTAIAWASASWFTNDDTAGSRQCKLTSYVDPQAGGVWTPALVDSMQTSAKTTDGNPDTWVSTMWAIVEYVPAVVASTDRPFPFRFVRKQPTRSQQQRLM